MISAINLLPGKLTSSYDAQEVPVGTEYIDTHTGKKYKFLKNEGSDSIAAKKCVKINDASKYAVEISDTLNGQDFAGCRVSGATDVDEDEYGWFQISGNATLTFGDSARATVDGEGVVLDDDTDKGNIGGANLAVTLSSAAIELVTDAVAGIFGIAQASVNTTDADVEVNIIRNAWGS